MYPYIKEISNDGTTNQVDLTSMDKVIHPNDWIIYKKGNIYTLCIDFLRIKTGNGCYGLPSHKIMSSSDNIVLEISDDKTICNVITDKYKYKFKNFDNNSPITNITNSSYKFKEIELLSIEKNIKYVNTTDKYYLELDDSILNFYIDGDYKWSKIISLRYTKGIYFVLKDKIFTVIDNGGSMLDILNLDGSLYKQIKTKMDYIESFNIIYKDNEPKILKLKGFIWQPIFVKQYIDIETLFLDRIKEVTYYEDDDGDEDNHYLNDTYNEDDFREY